MAGSPDTPPSLKRLTALGMSESVVRVSQYEPAAGNRGPDSSMKPVQWQAIVKHVDASKPWSVAVRDDPDTAEADAKAQFVRLYDTAKNKDALARAKAAPKPAPKPTVDLDEEDLI